MVTGEFNVFMTHVQNYGSDRLSLYTFGKLFKFLRETTNLRLLQVSAKDLAKKYFDRYPAEATTPIWTNPCVDKRHLEILPASRVAKCGDLPDFVILGPQKTGTTALMNFLKVLRGAYNCARVSHLKHDSDGKLRWQTKICDCRSFPSS